MLRMVPCERPFRVWQWQAQARRRGRRSRSACRYRRSHTNGAGCRTIVRRDRGDTTHRYAGKSARCRVLERSVRGIALSRCLQKTLAMRCGGLRCRSISSYRFQRNHEYERYACTERIQKIVETAALAGSRGNGGERLKQSAQLKHLQNSRRYILSSAIINAPQCP